MRIGVKTALSAPWCCGELPISYLMAILNPLSLFLILYSRRMPGCISPVTGTAQLCPLSGLMQDSACSHTDNLKRTRTATGTTLLRSHTPLRSD